ncbi:acetyl/propionyl/methylcrotonyl-CoA carboxylase subunit alpha [Nonomuraea sp. LPB2021202275-12-8]|uniref:acetyl/propionyl/methylcrotonyl-CoA carboxylase subunit alpha n=1 Tax=Nonomuraea sp. LPB2021202275-12-8 TaxID=3120159 RepID=UPI00300C9D8F
MITRLLVANRGEIARRVFRTCRELGIETVAVYSDADARAPHVAEADHAVRLSGDKPADTYLDADRLLAACRAAGADAVHPGYGFLSENAAFARAVLEAGLTWVGPPPPAIASMGDKLAAKRLMSEAGVPTLPSLAVTADGTLTDPGDDWEFPVLVKAAAGGGGRGMRVVREARELARQVASAHRESLAAFGDGGVFVEPLLEGARHVEVQVLADGHGTVWALGERDCSIQRRHQKVVEECPSPGITRPMRSYLEEAAVRAARAIGYVGAGTVEFLVAGERVAFLEMNTRLQVEHPVTELVYGVDLVRWQVAVAEGAALPPEPPLPAGHAVEVRLYAEDRAYLPQSGVLHRFEVSGQVRVDSGVESGSVVSSHYDPMLAKVIGYGASRGEAVRKVVSALRRARIHGLTTNRDLLLQILKNPDFAAGDTHTGFLDQHDFGGDGPPGELAVLAAALATAAANRERAPVLGGLPSGWRNVRSQPRVATFAEAEAVYDPLPAGVAVIEVVRTGVVAGDGAAGAAPHRTHAFAYQVVLERDGLRHAFEVSSYDGGVAAVYVDSATGGVRLTPVPRLPEPVEHVAPGSLLAPMPGSVLRVEVVAGERVAKGQPVLVLEAMKMEHLIAAPAGGVVSGVHVEKGQQVDAGAVLAIIQEGDS